VTGEHQKTTYQYDTFHRRLSKTSYIGQNGHWIESSRERYLYQGGKEIGSVGNSGTIEQLRVMGIGYKGEIGATVLMEIAGKSYVPLHHDRGNITMLLDQNTKQPIETYRYTAFGEENVPEQPISPWRIDPEIGWVYFGREAL
jgi:YD repeat-containing protein